MILEQALRYMQFIGILIWAVELGNIGIVTEVAVMSQYSASPRLRNLECLHDMFEYLKNNDMYRVMFDQLQPKVDENAFAPGTME